MPPPSPLLLPISTERACSRARRARVLAVSGRPAPPRDRDSPWRRWAQTRVLLGTLSHAGAVWDAAEDADRSENR